MFDFKIDQLVSQIYDILTCTRDLLTYIFNLSSRIYELLSCMFNFNLCKFSQIRASVEKNAIENVIFLLSLIESGYLLIVVIFFLLRSRFGNKFQNQIDQNDIDFSKIHKFISDVHSKGFSFHVFM